MNRILILNISMMIVAYYLGKTFASGVKQQKCIALECGLQNGTLAIFVSTQIFGTDLVYITPTAAYALIMYITGFIFVFLLIYIYICYTALGRFCPPAMCARVRSRQ